MRRTDQLVDQPIDITQRQTIGGAARTLQGMLELYRFHLERCQQLAQVVMQFAGDAHLFFFTNLLDIGRQALQFLARPD